MTTDTRTVTVEREFAHPPERVWRALTQPHLISEWLMDTDFRLALGQGFHLRGEWGTVDCKVLEIEAHASLSYTWDAMGLVSVVTWTLLPVGDGTLLRMEQAGFRQDQEQAYQGARFGWPKLFNALEATLAGIEA